MAEIRRIEIEPAENGGHTVTHHFHDTPSKKGLGSSYNDPEHHVFGEHEGHEMLAHVANHLKIAEPEEHGKLDTAERKKIPSSEFGLPGSRKYPMPNRSRAANAKARPTEMVDKGKLSEASAEKIRAKANRILGK
jgi:hypothetical protein